MKNETTPIVAPIIHLNGDAAQTLINRLEAQVGALTKVITLLREDFPHGRNYYPAPGLYELARAQQERRLETLDSLREALIKELALIQIQTNAQRRKY